MDANWRNALLVCRTDGPATADELVPSVSVAKEPQEQMRPDLLGCFELSELEKYYTDAELTEHPERKG
jgi:succinate dehydrogenase / fumarate reductase flavoprotein subunit